MMHSHRHGLGTAGRLAVAAIVATLAAYAASANASAASSEWARTDQSAVRLVSAVSGVGRDPVLRIGLQFALQPGWKTYWRSPGDAGFPVTAKWQGSGNLAKADLSWPVPERFTLFGLDTFGYEGEVVFPVRVRLERPGEPVRLRASVDYLACEKICIPYHAELALDLPAGPALATEFTQLIDRYAAQVPGDGAAHGLQLESVGVSGEAEHPSLEVVARSFVPFAHPDLIVEGPAGLWFAAPAVRLEEDAHLARLTVPVTVDQGAPSLEDAALTLTLVDGRRGLERAVTPGGPIVSQRAVPAALLPMLLVALLGGLILNLMPCVLPVLSLKLVGFVGHGGGGAREIRAAFLATAAGIVASFLVLAAALAALKAAGLAVGWGIQFQQPLFLAGMVVLLTLFACNLWGWFDIPLPAWLGEPAVRVGGARGSHGTLGGHFITGALATLLATPCSAPFVGTAVGFALSRGTGEIVAIFSALAIGLSVPYLAVACVPRLASWLPRPGRWMARLRTILGFLLAGTAVWLLTVLAAQRSPIVALLVAAAMLAAAAALWARRRLPLPLRLASPAAVVVLALAAILASAQPRSGLELPTSRAAGVWQPFEESRIPGLIAAGKLVIVDVTADWCITCQVNKRLVLNDQDIARLLDDPGVVAMQADWTRPDDGISRYLASFGRYGIPFNVVYGPRAPAGLPLPELLTKPSVVEAIERARGS